MKEDLRLRVRKLCAEAIIRKVLTKQESLDYVQPHASGMSSAVCPGISQSIRANVSINPPGNMEETEALIREAELLAGVWDYALTDSPRAETTLDKVVRNIKPDAWPNEILLLITPSAEHKSEYKLHVLDRQRNGQFLGATNISSDVLAELKSSRALQQYCIVLGNNDIDLTSCDQKSAFMQNLLNTLGHKPQNGLVKAHSVSNIYRQFGQIPHMAEQQVIPYHSAPELEQMNELEELAVVDELDELDELEEPRQLADTNLMEIMERINTSHLPTARDVHKFFDLAECYEFKIYIRPELCWKRHANVERDNMVRFHVECFMRYENYVGSINLDEEQLQQALNAHPGVLQHVQVITDVCEITPLPTPMMKFIRTIFTWLGMEIIYDAFGEFIFDLYKNYIHA